MGLSDSLMDGVTKFLSSKSADSTVPSENPVRDTQIALARQRTSRFKMEKWLRRGAAVMVGAAVAYFWFSRKRGTS